MPAGRAGHAPCTQPRDTGGTSRMRLVTVSAPKGKGMDVTRIAFACGIPDVSINDAVRHKPGSQPSPRDVVDMKVATPDAKKFIDSLVEAPFFDRSEYAIDVREPRSVLKSTSTRDRKSVV